MKFKLVLVLGLLIVACDKGYTETSEEVFKSVLSVEQIKALKKHDSKFQVWEKQYYNKEALEEFKKVSNQKHPSVAVGDFNQDGHLNAFLAGRTKESDVEKNKWVDILFDAEKKEAKAVLNFSSMPLIDYRRCKSQDCFKNSYYMTLSKKDFLSKNFSSVYYSSMKCADKLDKLAPLNILYVQRDSNVSVMALDKSFIGTICNFTYREFLEKMLPKSK